MLKPYLQFLKEQITEDNWREYIKPLRPFTGIPRGVIINHYGMDLEGTCLVNFFGGIDVISYDDFSTAAMEAYDYIVLSGGDLHISWATDLVEEKEFLRTTPKPIFGICLGLQILSIIEGVPLKNLPATRLYFEPLPVFNRTGELFYYQECYVDTLPPGYDGLLYQGMVKMITHQTRPILALQGHPEYSGAFGEFIRDTWFQQVL